MTAQTTASNNVAVGNQALQTNETGTEIVAIGHEAAKANLADNITAVGYRALLANTTGSNNLAIGNDALLANTTGTRNLAIGVRAYSSSDTENDNLAIGYQTMETNTAGGTQCVAVGNYALDSNTSGDKNIGIGMHALGGMTNGNQNIGIGHGTGTHTSVLSTGERNILIGSSADTSSAGSNDQIVMGEDVTGNADNSFVFGRGGTDSAIAFGATSISAPSDIRLKENINDDVAGLSFINDLRPVTFNWKKEKDIPKEMITYKAGSEKRYNNNKLNHGFIAQEVKTVIDNHSEVKDGFKMWFEDEIDGRQRIAEGALVPMLVKSIQELSAKVETLTRTLICIRTRSRISS